MAEVNAQLNGLRLAPRKVRVVSDLVKGKNVVDAINQLGALIKRPSKHVEKLLKSAIANAENNYKMVRENLYIKSIKVDEGVKLKRFKPKGFGRVSPIEKKTSRISVVLAEKVPGMKKDLQIKEKTDEALKDQTINKIKEDREFKKPDIKTELSKKEGRLKNLSRKMFRRKSI